MLRHLHSAPPPVNTERTEEINHELKTGVANCPSPMRTPKARHNIIDRSNILSHIVKIKHGLCSMPREFHPTDDVCRDLRTPTARAKYWRPSCLMCLDFFRMPLRLTGKDMISLKSLRESGNTTLTNHTKTKPDVPRHTKQNKPYNTISHKPYDTIGDLKIPCDYTRKASYGIIRTTVLFLMAAACC